MSFDAAHDAGYSLSDPESSTIEINRSAKGFLLDLNSLSSFLESVCNVLNSQNHSVQLSLVSLWHILVNKTSKKFGKLTEEEAISDRLNFCDHKFEGNDLF